MNPSALSALEEKSRDLVPPVCARLAAFCGDPAAHARFLNMLSLMEHIGSRKIMLSQAEAELVQSTLRHLAEESRHAYFFKRIAEKLARRPLSFGETDTVAPASARSYMGRLDATITDSLSAGGAELPYLYMSLIVELRAVWLYRLYQQVLDDEKTGIALKSVLAEEELHLDAMLARLRETDPEASRHMQEFASLEDAQFRALWRAVESDGKAERLAAE
jgi:rubrerythrin